LFASHPQNIFTKFTQEIRDKRVFFNLTRDYLKSCTQKSNSNNQMFEYFMKCKQAKTPVMPILFKIQDKKLRLQEYFLNKASVNALSSVISQFPLVLNSIHLNRNGIMDGELGTLLSSLQELERCKSIVIRHNEFKAYSLQNIIPILDRGNSQGKNLDELRLVSINSSPETLQGLLQILSENCYLKKLGLVQCKLQSYHVERLAIVLDDNKHLQELDLIWNDLPPKNMVLITDILGRNRTLMHVNLSWNFLTHQQKNMQALGADRPEEGRKEIKDLMNYALGNPPAECPNSP